MASARPLLLKDAVLRRRRRWLSLALMVGLMMVATMSWSFASTSGRSLKSQITRDRSSVLPVFADLTTEPTPSGFFRRSGYTKVGNIQPLVGGGDEKPTEAEADPTGKVHLSIVICGHVDSGKSTMTGRLLFELGGIDEREMETLKTEAKNMNKETFLFAFFMDKQKEERERGVTITCATKEFFTEKWHYTIIDAPGHRDFIKNMISGAAQADVAILMMPADGNAHVAIQKGDHKAGEVQGQTRHHARLLNLLGVKQLLVAINKMDCDQAKYSEKRFNDLLKELKAVMIKSGWKKDFLEKSVPFLPLSGYEAQNLLKKSDKMDWWKGNDIVTSWGEKVHVDCIYDFLEKCVKAPERVYNAPLRIPIAGVYKIKGVGDVMAGRVEQGILKNEADVRFLPSDVPNSPCTGKVYSIEMHHKRLDVAKAGDNIGMNVRGFARENPPRAGDVMILESDSTLQTTGEFTAQVQVLDVPKEIKPGYTPIAFVRCGRSACKLKKINWKMGKDTGGKKAENPDRLKKNDMAEVVFEPMFGLVAESFKVCEGMARVAFLDGNGVVMLGKIIKTKPKEYKDEDDGKKDGKGNDAKAEAKPDPKVVAKKSGKKK
uniref:Translation elongation factor 1A-like n=1 Tax=Lotharella vacuolata TaxID=74820 RepID=B5A4P8_9EUKA|nr:translation elongation factor 1A-like [Lotharella vacuolata]